MHAGVHRYMFVLWYVGGRGRRGAAGMTELGWSQRHGYRDDSVGVVTRQWQ